MGTPFEDLVAHLHALHPRLRISSRDTAETLGKLHTRDHWRFDQRSHFHEGLDLGASHRPPGWKTGDDVVLTPKRMKGVSVPLDPIHDIHESPDEVPFFFDEEEMRDHDENFWDCPGCNVRMFMGDPACRSCGWNGKVRIADITVTVAGITNPYKAVVENEGHISGDERAAALAGFRDGTGDPTLVFWHTPGEGGSRPIINPSDIDWTGMRR